MGKVGSATVGRALWQAGVPLYHVHTFTGIEERAMYAERLHPAIDAFHGAASLDERARRLAGSLETLRSRTTLRIVTLVRDPVATTVSRFFQDLHLGPGAARPGPGDPMRGPIRGRPAG